MHHNLYILLQLPTIQQIYYESLLINTDHYQMSPPLAFSPSSAPLFSLSLSFPLPPCFTQLFSLKQWSQWKIGDQARPAPQSHSLSVYTQMYVHGNRCNIHPHPHLAKLTTHAYTSAFHEKYLTEGLNSFQRPLQDQVRRSSRWHCVSSVFRGKGEWRAPLLLLLLHLILCSCLDEEVNQMYPPPSSTERRVLQKKYKNASKMCISCYLLSSDDMYWFST